MKPTNPPTHSEDKENNVMNNENNEASFFLSENLFEGTVTYSNTSKYLNSFISKDNDDQIIDRKIPEQDITEQQHQQHSQSFLNELIKNPTTLAFFPFIWKTAIVAFPAMFLNLNLTYLQTVNYVFIGFLSDNESIIQGVGAVIIYINFSLMSLYTGLVSGIETLCSNAYATKKYKLMGYYFQRARIIGYALTIIIIVIHYFTAEHVLRLFGLSDSGLSYAKQYLYTYMPFALFDVQCACIIRLLNIVEKSHVNMIILLIEMALHPLWNYILVVKLNLGVFGSGIAFTFSVFITCVLSTAYLWMHHPQPEANFWINKKCFHLKGIWNYIKFSTGTALLTCAEWWGTEIQSMIAISMGDINYTVYALMSDLSNFLYPVDVGFMSSVTIYAGQLIAKGTVKQVKLCCVYSLCFAVICKSIILSVFFVYRKNIFDLFTEEEHIRIYAYPVLTVLTIAEFFNVIQSCLVSVFRGIGKQYLGSAFMFVHYYVIMVVLSYFLGIVQEKGVIGIYYSIGLSDAGMSIIYVVVLCSINFHQAQKDTIARLLEDNAVEKAKVDYDESKIHMQQHPQLPTCRQFA